MRADLRSVDGVQAKRQRRNTGWMTASTGGIAAATGCIAATPHGHAKSTGNGGHVSVPVGCAARPATHDAVSAIVNLCQKKCSVISFLHRLTWPPQTDYPPAHPLPIHTSAFPSPSFRHPTTHPLPTASAANASPHPPAYLSPPSICLIATPSFSPLLVSSISLQGGGVNSQSLIPHLPSTSVPHL